MGKASNRKNKRRQGTGVSRADLERQRALEELARAAQQLGGMFEARREHLAAVSRLLVARGRAGGRGGAELGGGLGRRPLFRRLADEELCRGSAARDGGDTFGGGLRR